jgi:hypothetical protein
VTVSVTAAWRRLSLALWASTDLTSSHRAKRLHAGPEDGRDTAADGVTWRDTSRNATERHATPNPAVSRPCRMSRRHRSDSLRHPSPKPSPMTSLKPFRKPSRSLARGFANRSGAVTLRERMRITCCARACMWRAGAVQGGLEPPSLRRTSPGAWAGQQRPPRVPCLLQMPIDAFPCLYALVDFVNALSALDYSIEGRL